MWTNCVDFQYKFSLNESGWYRFLVKVYLKKKRIENQILSQYIFSEKKGRKSCSIKVGHGVIVLF